MNHSTANHHRLFLSVLSLSLLACGARGAGEAERLKLENGVVSAGFGSGGLLRITELASQQSVLLAEEPATVMVNGQKLTVPGLKLADLKHRKDSVTYHYAAGDKQLHVI